MTQDLLNHALQRCQRLPHDDKLLCERSIQGKGKVTGSVEAGGLLRELLVEVRPSPGSGRLAHQGRVSTEFTRHEMNYSADQEMHYRAFRIQTGTHPCRIIYSTLNI